MVPVTKRASYRFIDKCQKGIGSIHIRILVSAVQTVGVQANVMLIDAPLLLGINVLVDVNVLLDIGNQKTVSQTACWEVPPDSETWTPLNWMAPNCTVYYSWTTWNILPLLPCTSRKRVWSFSTSRSSVYNWGGSTKTATNPPEMSRLPASYGWSATI